MLQYIKEYGKYVEITGYSDVAFEAAEAFLKANRKQSRRIVDIQFFDAQLIVGQEHLYFSVLNALQAFQNSTNHSKSPAMETILYASAQRQIQKAIALIGIKSQTKNVAVAIIGEDPKQIQSELEALTESMGKEPDDKVLEMTKTKETKIRKAFEIGEEELKTVMKEGNLEMAIVNLVIERVALLSTQF